MLAKTASVALLVFAACNTTPNYKLDVGEPPLSVELGEFYSHRFDSSKYHESNGFENCLAGSPLEVNNSGLVHFKPNAIGKVKLCVALTYEGKEIDKYEYVVEVTELSPEKRDARKASNALFADYAAKLAAMRQTTQEIQTPQILVCPSTLAELPASERQLAVFPENVPRRNLDTLAKFEQLEELFAIAPAQIILRKIADSAEELAKLQEVVSGSHAVLYRFTELSRPKVVGDEFTGGHASGWMFILNTANAEVVCQAPFRYRPPSTISVKSPLLGKPGDKPSDGFSEFAILRQMHARGHSAFSAVLKEMSPGLTAVPTPPSGPR